MNRNEIPADLEWLARNVDKWPDCFKAAGVKGGEGYWGYSQSPTCPYTKSQWLQARQLLGLETPEVTEAEDEAWQAMEEKNQSSRSKYHREIKPGVWVDVYDVLHAWRVQNPALQHLIKKALVPGSRGHKDIETDLREILASAERAIQLEGFE